MDPALIQRLILHLIETYRIRRAPKVVLGGGVVSVEGCVVTDIGRLDVTLQQDFGRYWKQGSRAAFLAEHVWEHLEPANARRAAENCYIFLKAEGRLRIAVPDGYHPSPEYIESVRPSGKPVAAHRITEFFTIMKP